MTSTLGIKKIQYPNGTNIATLDSSGSITFDGAITGTLATAAQPNVNSLGTLSTLTVDDITINGSTISDAGDFILDIGGDITLDADGQQIYLKNNGTHWGTLLTNGTPQHFYIDATISDGDIIFRGNDGGSTINALTLDMSAAGQANFNSNIFTGNTGEFVDGSGAGDKGIQLNPIGMVVSTRNGGISGIFGRQTSDGTIVQFRKNGSEVGRIVYANATNIAFGNASKGIGVGTGSVFPTDGSTSIGDAGLDLGYASSRFKDLYLSGGVFLGGTGTANKLDDYEEGTFTPNFLGSGDNYNPTHTFRFGQYTKIGDTVYFTLRCASSSRTENGDQIYISGLPFSANYGNSGISDGFPVRGNGMKIDFGVGYVYGNMTHTNSVITLLMQGYNVGNGSGIDNFRQHDMHPSHDVRISGFYKTTA